MTVFEIHGLCCPKCGRDDNLRVQATVLVELTGAGCVTQGDTEWLPESGAYCNNCETDLTVAQLSGREAQMAHLLRGLYESDSLAPFDLDRIEELLDDRT